MHAPRLLVAGFLMMTACLLVRAEEYKGAVKSVDAGRKKLTLTISDKVRTFDVAKDVAIFSLTDGQAKKPPQIVSFTGGLGALKAGTKVTIMTEVDDDDNETVSTIKLDNGTTNTTPKKKKK